jgi:hypothetical protein
MERVAQKYLKENNMTKEEIDELQALLDNNGSPCECRECELVRKLLGTYRQFVADGYIIAE